MTLLSDLAPEILDSIFSLESSSHKVIPMWMCGNRRLQSVLARGITVVKLKNEKMAPSSRFPVILTYLRSLRSLTVDCGPNSLDDVDVIYPLLRQLSSTIQELVFKFEESQEIFLDQSGAPIWLLEESVTPSTMNNDVPSSEYIWNVKAQFPRLRRLVLLGKPVIPFSDLQHLPLELETLEITWDGKDKQFKSFPRTLTSLKLGSLNYFNLELTAAEASQLPPNLTKLELPHYSAVMSYFLPALPRTLTAHPCYITGWSFLLASQVPPLINSLYIAELDFFVGGKAVIFPNHLTKLGLETEQVPMPRSILQSLPRTIIELKISGLEWEDVQQSDWPPLQTLFIYMRSFNPELEPSMMDVLPRTLTDFSYLGSPTGEEVLQHLDLPKLKTLYIDLKRSPGMVRPASFCLSDTITYFSVEHYEGDIILNAPSTDEDSDLDYMPLELFPKFLTRLCICESRIAASQLHRLPRTLIQIDIGDLFNDRPNLKVPYVPQDIFSGLPSGLEQLIVDTGPKDDDIEEAFRFLPKSLRVVEFSNPVYPHQVMKRLQLPELEGLTIHVDCMDDTILDTIPKTLKELDLRIDCDQSTPAGLTNAPPFMIDWYGATKFASLYKTEQRKRIELIRIQRRLNRHHLSKS